MNIPGMASSNTESPKSPGVLREENTSLVRKHSTAPMHELISTAGRGLRVAGLRGCSARGCAWGPGRLGPSISPPLPGKMNTQPPVTERGTGVQRSQVSCHQSHR